MRHLAKTLSKMLFFLIAAVISIGGSMYAIERFGSSENFGSLSSGAGREKFEKFTGLNGVARSLEAIRIRSAHPTWHPDLIALKAAEGAKAKGVMGVLMSMDKKDPAPASSATAAPDAVTATTGQNGQAAPKPSEGDVYVSVAQNREAMLQAQTPPNANASATDIKGAVRDQDLSGHRIAVGSTSDGREVYGVVHQTGTEDLNAVDRINALHIPEELKEKILRNYHQTGILPEILVREKRKPAAAPTGSEFE